MSNTPYSFVVQLSDQHLQLSPEELDELIRLRLTSLNIMPQNITIRHRDRTVGTFPYVGEATTPSIIRRLRVLP